MWLIRNINYFDFSMCMYARAYVGMNMPAFEVLSAFNLMCTFYMHFRVFLHCDVLVNRYLRWNGFCGVNFFN